MAAVDTSLHQRCKGGDSRVPQGGRRGKAELSSPCHGAMAHSPVQGEGLCPVTQQVSGDVPLCGQEAAPARLPGIHPSLRLLKPRRARAVALPAPHLTGCGKRPDEK